MSILLPAATVGGTLLSGAALGTLYLAHRAAVNKQHATYVEEETMEFKYQGNNLDKIWLNSDDYGLIPSVVPGGKIVHKSDPDYHLRDKPTFLQRKRGWYWVGWLYPADHVLEFEVTAGKIIGPNLVKGAEAQEVDSVSKLVEFEAVPRKVKFLMRSFPVPILVMGSEAKDGSKVDLLLQITVRVIYPLIPVVRYRGKFYQPLEAAVSSVVNDIVIAAKNYKDFRDRLKNLNPLKGQTAAPGSQFSFANQVKSINLNTVSSTGEVTSVGIIESLGLEITDVWLVGYSLSKEDQQLDKALKLKEIRKAEGQALVEQAKHQKAADQELALGQAAYAREEVAALNGARPDVVRAFGNVRTARALADKDSPIKVLSLGQGGIINTNDVSTYTTDPTPPQQGPPNTAPKKK